MTSNQHNLQPSGQWALLSAIDYVDQRDEAHLDRLHCPETNAYADITSDYLQRVADRLACQPVQHDSADGALSAALDACDGQLEL